tara:strand:+ start:1105 stop:1536 length:432 start_codon:yes stop_codon:yes gene_type:complete
MHNSIEQRPFHLAISVHDLKIARIFYNKKLGFNEGRSSNSWIDYNFFGHQLVIHETKEHSKSTKNLVDGHGVPIPHFGVVLSMQEWNLFKNKLVSKNIRFIIEPHIRFKDSTGEQATMFFLDPSGNSLEFKAFKNLKNLFKKI